MDLNLTNEEREALAKRVIEDGVEDLADTFGPNGASASWPYEIEAADLEAIEEAEKGIARFREILGEDFLEQIRTRIPCSECEGKKRVIYRREDETEEEARERGPEKCRMCKGSGRDPGWIEGDDDS